jgi:hypothetical protein
MDKENFAMQLIEKQLRRDEYKFYTVCALFFVFMLFAFLWPTSSDTDTTQKVTANDNVTVTNEVK